MISLTHTLTTQWAINLLRAWYDLTPPTYYYYNYSWKSISRERLNNIKICGIYDNSSGTNLRQIICDKSPTAYIRQVIIPHLSRSYLPPYHPPSFSSPTTFLDSKAPWSNLCCCSAGKGNCGCKSGTCTLCRERTWKLGWQTRNDLYAIGSRF